MAGDWIKMRSNLWDDPRVARLCDLTDQVEATVIGALYWLWATADQHTEDGRMNGLSLRGIDRKTGVAGIGEALENVGWIETYEGGIKIVRFGEHNGASAKRRSAEAKRKAEGRKVSASGADKQRTESGHDAELEKEKEKEKEKNKSKPPAPSASDGAEKLEPYPLEFEELWEARPRRQGQDNKRKALKAWRARQRDGHSHDEMIEGVRRYRRFLKAAGKIGTEYVQMTSTFLGPDKHFEDEWALPDESGGDKWDQVLAESEKRFGGAS